MNEDGQVYADFDGTAPEADRERFRAEERQALLLAEAKEAAYVADLQRAIRELEARDGSS